MLSGLYFNLPAADRADLTDLSDVTAVVWLEWSDDVVGTYTDGTSACVKICTVSVVDLVKERIVGSKTYRGGQPPERITYSELAQPGKAYGDPPDLAGVVDFINGFFQ